MSDVRRFLKLLEENIGEPPVWNPKGDQQAEFDRWKKWSSEIMLHRTFKRYCESGGYSDSEPE